MLPNDGAMWESSPMSGAPKNDVLDSYRGTECYWIEDKAENADVGAERGLNSILMAHDHNRDYVGPAERLGNWEQIYNRIIGQ